MSAILLMGGPLLVYLGTAGGEQVRGAFLFRKAVKSAFPRHRILEIKEPVFANVRGFQLAGMTYARTVLAADRDRSTAAERAAGDAA